MPHTAHMFWRWGTLYFLKHFAIACEHPNLATLRNGRLHCERSPAVEYADGTRVWALNGIRVEPWMAEDDATSWTEEKVLGVQNVDQRREVIARYGMDRLWSKAKILDQQKGEDGYELGELDVTGSPRRYLCMRNRSIGCFHVEAVSPECTTVQQAHLFRENRTDRQSAQNGADYYQHGDVLFWPEGKKMFKPRPVVLT